MTDLIDDEALAARFALNPGPPPELPPPELPPDVPLAGDTVLFPRCRFCDKEFKSGPGGWLSKGRHEKKEHPEEWHAARDEDAPRGAPADKTKKRPARPAVKARIPAEDWISRGITGLGWMLMRSSPSLPPLGPMGAMIAFEAPIAAPVADQALAGSVLDRLVLQRLAGAESTFEQIGPLIVAPLIVGAMAAYPDFYDQLAPLLKETLRPMLPQFIAQLERTKAAEADARAQALQLADMDPSFAELFHAGGDPLDAIIAAIFPALPGPADGPPPN